MSDQEITDLTGWLTGRLPDGWFAGAPDVSVDRDEIVIVGRLADAPESDAGAAAARGRIKRFREETRERRIEIARELERRFGRKVAWGAQVGDEREVFTSVGVPVMTRLRQPERKVL
ncbi:MAG: hypothetical protein LC640_12290, partial [Frankia sp.]|nr:hypothetical protein [Frankia sp.]